MKAVIMAGGEGSRLRPLTCTMPKPMARLLGKPTLRYILDLLSNNGVDEAVITLKYMPKEIEDYVADNKNKKMKITTVTEEEYLGTAGGVKNAAKNFDSTFIVISGDAYCNFELDKAVNFHKSAKASATVICTRVSDPREYGLVSLDENNRIERFIEKPAWSQAVSDKANTGIYILEPECLKMIPDGEMFDFSKQLFPIMMEKNMPLYGYEEMGYWCDIGDLTAYRICQEHILNEMNNGNIAENIVTKEELPKGNYSIEPPVFIGKDVTIGENTVIGPFAVIEDGVSIGENAKIVHSVLLEDSTVGSGASIYKAVLCENSAVRRNSQIFENSAVGAGSVIGENSVVCEGVLIWPEKQVGKDVCVNKNLKYGTNRREIFDDYGIGTDERLDAEKCAAIGEAIGSVFHKKKIGIACDGNQLSKAMMYSMLSGIASAGAHAWNFGDCFAAQMSFFTSFCSLAMGVFIECHGDEIRIKLCSEGGLSLPRSVEREIESKFSRREFKTAAENEIRIETDMSSVNMMYRRELLRQCSSTLSGMSVMPLIENDKIAMLFEDCIGKLDAKIGNGITINIGYDGAGLSVIENNIDYPFNKILALLCLYEAKNGHDIAVPYDAPQVIASIAGVYERKVYRYIDSPADERDSEARKLAKKQIWTRDALFMSIKLLSLIHDESRTLKELCADLPDFYIENKVLNIDFSPSMLNELFSSAVIKPESVSEGLLLRRNGARTLVIPSRTGRRIRIVSESFSFEAAADMCEEITRKIETFSLDKDGK